MSQPETEESVVANPFNDPFIDDQFSSLDLRGDNLTSDLNRIAEEDNPVLQAQEPEPEAALVAEEKPEPDEPKIFTYEDGSSVKIEKSSKGWKATLSSNTGSNPEVFYGQTKDDLLFNLSAGKLKATQKIREMNRQIKLEGGPSASQPTAPTPSGTPKTLSADEVFDIKTKLSENPDLALETWFQKKTGLSVGELIRLAKLGKSASDELQAEAVSKEFLAAHPEYLPVEKNFKALIAYLCKYELGQPLAGRDPNAMIEVLHDAGKFTLEHLNRAYEELLSDGFLEVAASEPEPEPEEEPVEEKPAVVAKPAAAAQTPASGRIAREERRPRAGLGIRARETVATQTGAEKPPSVEELDNLSDEALGKIYSDIRKSRAGTRR